MLALAANFGAMYAEKSTPDSIRTMQLQDVQVVSTRAKSNNGLLFTNFNKQQIKAVNFGQDIPFILSMSPSVTTTSDAGTGIGYTTLRVRGTEPSRINVTANGVPVNDAESSTVFWVNFADFASSAQSIQLSRGAGTSSNGAGAFGANINIQTENISVNPFVGVDASAGSYYTNKETFRFGTGLLGGHWALQGRFSHIGTKGYVDRADAQLYSYFVQAGYFTDKTMVKFLTYNGWEETGIAWNYTSKYEQEMYGRTYNSCGEYYENGTRKYYADNKDHYNSQNYQLIWNQILRNNWNLNTVLSYTRGDGYTQDYKANKNIKDYGLSTYKFKTDLIRRKTLGNNFFAAQSSVNYDNKKDLSASIGMGWNKYDGDHYGEVKWLKEEADIAYTPDFKYYKNNARKYDFNIFGKISARFLEDFTGFADLQYRYVGYQMQDPRDEYVGYKVWRYDIRESYNFFNPKFGLNYDIDQNNKVYISYAISGKEPVRNNFQEWYGVWAAGNESYERPKQETLFDLEVGYKYVSEKISASANFYYMDYRNQFVLTGELDAIGQAKTKNIKDSYRMGVEVEAAWTPVKWFRWDINGTWSKNRAKDMTVLLDDYTTVYTIGGETPLAFSPEWIGNNKFTFMYKGFTGTIMTQYVSKQYMNNTGFESYETTDDNGNVKNVSMMLGEKFATNIDLSYNFSVKKLGLKDATIGVTLYNIFSKKYDNNGWAYCSYKEEGGKLKAYNTKDMYEAGFAPSAPFNWMAHLSLNF